MRSADKNTHWTVRTAKRLWSYRLEIATLVGSLAALWGLEKLPWFGSAGVLLFALAILAAPIKRKPFYGADKLARFLERRVHGSHIKREVVRAARDSGFSGLKVEKVAPTLPGEMVTVRIPRGQTPERLDSIRREMRVCLRTPDVRVIHNRHDPSLVDLSIIRRDVFASMAAMPWPLLEAESVDIRQGVPFAMDEYGRVVNARLLSSNILMGGAPNAGKSVALRMIIAAAALDPKAKLWLMDAKTGGAEFVHWAPAVGSRLVRGRDLEAAVEMLADLEERVEKRGRDIVAAGKDFVLPDMEIDVLVIDELPQFMRVLETDSKIDASYVKTIRERIWKLIAMGRWTGMITVLAAQKPTADIVPSESRDLIDGRFALHCNTRQMSDAILGDGAGGEVSFNAAEIPTGQHGVGYFMGDDGTQKVRSFFISIEQAQEIASRVAGRQMDAELERMR